MWATSSVVSPLSLVGCERSDPSPEAALPIQQGSLTQGEHYLSLGQLEEAGQHATALEKSAPDDWRTHDLAARVHLGHAVTAERDGRMEAITPLMRAAAGSYQKAILCDGRIAGLWRNAADAAWLAGDRADAVAWYEQSMQLDDQDPRAPLRLAQAAFDSDPDQARALLEHVIVLDADIAEAHASLAVLDAIEGDDEKALLRMDHAVALSPTSPGIRVVQARVARLLGEPSRGVEVILSLSAPARSTEAASLELEACWGALRRPDRIADAWEACFVGNAHRSDAWRFAVRAAEAALAAGDRGRAATLLDRASMVGAPAIDVEKVRAQAAQDASVSEGG